MFFRELIRGNSPGWQVAALFSLAVCTTDSLAQGTAFTYQGRLNDGANPASGIYDLRFAIYDAASLGTQRGNSLTNLATAVSNGLFTVSLDFGNQFPGADRWLDIALRTNGANLFTSLTPRPRLAAVPYAITAGNLSGNISTAQLPVSVVTNGASGVTISGSFTGDGGGISNVVAAGLVPNSGGSRNRFTNAMFYDATPTASYILVTNRAFQLPGAAGQSNPLCLYSVVDPATLQLSSIGFLDGSTAYSPYARFAGFNWFPHHTDTEMEMTIDSPGSMALGWANESQPGVALQPNRSLQIGINPSEYGRLENIYIQGNYNSYANPNMGFAIPLSFNSAYKSNGINVNQLMTLWAHATTTNGESRLTLYDNWDQSATADLKSHNFSKSKVRAEFITQSANGMGGLDVYGRLWSTNFTGDGSHLTNLSDANLASANAANAQVLTYNSTLGRYMPSNFPTTGGGTNLPSSSWAKIISLTPPANGDTNWFGPWTPGTLTAGIQEAINSLPRATSGNTPGGGMIYFTPGAYYTTTNIYSPVTSNPFSLGLVGSGMTASGITYIGNNPQNVLTIGQKQSKTAQIFTLENMWIASNVNACTNIIDLEGPSDIGGTSGGGIARGYVRFCYIGYWASMTNNNCFGIGVFTPSSCGDGLKHNLVGIKADLGFNDPISINQCSMNYLGTAIAYAGDHLIIEDNTFEQCGRGVGNDWPTSSFYYPGATITLYDSVLWAGNKDWRIKGNNFVNCPLHYLAQLNTTSPTNMYYRLVNNIVIDDDSDESGYALAATTGATLTFINPKASSYYPNPLVSYYITNTANYTSFNTLIASNTPANGSNVVAIVDLRLGTITTGEAFGGPVSAPTFNGSGAGLTNLNAAQLTGTLPVTNLPGLTTNVVVTGATFYVTNGLIMRITKP